MRILLIHNSYRSAQPSGEDMVVAQELELLTAAGHEVVRHFVESDSIAGMTKIEKAKVPFRVTWSPADRRKVAQLLATHDIDVIHLHNPFPLISASILAAAKDFGVPVVMTLHNYRLFCAAGTLLREGKPCTACLPRSSVPALVHGCYRDSRAATAPLAVSIDVHRLRGSWSDGVTTFVVMSEFARSMMTRYGIPDGKITVKPHFIPRPDTLADAQAPDAPFGLFLGRLSKEKGADVLVDAWKPSMGTLVIAGSGPLEEELRLKARAHGDSVRFVGALPRDQAMRLLSRAQYLVNPSNAFETFGLTVVEAFAHGVPVIVPDHGVFSELVESGTTGLRFTPGDSHALADALDVMSDPSTCRAWGETARSVYLERYTPEANLVLLEHVYRSAMSGSSAPAT